MFGKFGKALALAGVALATFGLAAPAYANWREARSEHFIVYGDMSEGDLRDQTENLERFDALLRHLFKVEESVRVSVFILPNARAVQRLAGDRNVLGFYNASAQLAYGFVPERMRRDIEGMSPEAISRHEYAHHMLLGATDRYVPGWASEGLAEFFMTAILDDDGSITIGASNPGRKYSMGSLQRWSVEELLTSDDRELGKYEGIERYTSGWLMIHYLWMSGERPGQYVKFIDLLNKTGDALESGKEAFGDLDQLDRELSAYLRRKGLPSAKFTAEQLNTPTEMSFRELRPGEEAILPFRMKSLLGVTAETAPKLAEEARPVAAQYPDDPFVQRTMAEIEYDAKDYVAAEAAADRALELEPNNVMAMAYKGRIAVQRAMKSDDEAEWAASRSWFLKANAADPNHPLPFELYYDSFVAEGITPPEDAVAGLYRAAYLMPQDLSLRARATVELIRSGDVRRARYVLAPAAFNPHAADDNPMRKLINKIDENPDVDALLDYIDAERFDDRFNEFLLADVVAEEEKEGEGDDGGEE